MSRFGRFRLPRLLPRIKRRGFLRADDGVTAIEFGILGLPFFAIVGAIMETALVFLAGNILDSALSDSVRLIRTGQAQDAGYTITEFKSQICNRTFGLLDCNGILVSVRTETSFGAISYTVPVDPDDGSWTFTETYNAGQRKSIVVAEAYYKWPAILDIMNFNLTSLPDGTVLLGAAKAWRNEPY